MAFSFIGTPMGAGSTTDVLSTKAFPVGTVEQVANLSDSNAGQFSGFYGLRMV